eukprot:scpid65115/ scgid34918/ Selenoprotein N
MVEPSTGSSPAADDNGGAPQPAENARERGGLVKKPGACRRCWQWTWSLSVPLFGVLLAISGYEMMRSSMVQLGFISPFYSYENLEIDVDENVQAMFMGYDQDLDGYLSMNEFTMLYPKLVGQEPTSALEMNNQTNMTDFDDLGEVLLLTSHFQPLVMDSMEKANDKLGVGFDSRVFHGLKAWQKASHNKSALSVSYLRPLLEGMNSMPVVGDVWDILSPSYMQRNHGLSSTRIYPPKPTQAVESILFKLMSHFHPRPFVMPRFGPFGCRGVLVAENEENFDVLIRLHAEFQVNAPPQYAFWFTPGQFMIRMVINRSLEKIDHFHLYVPATKALNVDMEWQTGHGGIENMEVDIGFLPQMELRMHAPSVRAPDPLEGEVEDENGTTRRVFVMPDADNLHESTQEQHTNPSEMKWNSKISEEEAASILEKAFFDFKKVPYVPFLDAFQYAQKESKLVHLILLWGVLDDQSC